MHLPEKIETRRLTIRPFQPGDQPSFLEFMLDEMATEYLSFTEEQKTEQGATALFRRVMDSYRTNAPIISLAIVDKDSGMLIGSCGISPLGEEGVYECYYSLLPKCWGMGFATEATRALLRHFFGSGEVKVMKAYVSPDNPRSIHVAERLGMELRGKGVHPFSGMEGLVYEIRKG